MVVKVASDKMIVSRMEVCLPASEPAAAEETCCCQLFAPGWESQERGGSQVVVVVCPDQANHSEMGRGTRGRGELPRGPQPTQLQCVLG